jgi:hypothetical protein
MGTHVKVVDIQFLFYLVMFRFYTLGCIFLRQTSKRIMLEVDPFKQGKGRVLTTAVLQKVKMVKK